MNAILAVVELYIFFKEDCVAKYLKICIIKVKL